MSELGDSGRASGVVGLNDMTLTVSRRNAEPVHTKLHEFMKEGRYVDVTLKFDDGKEISCHRCVGAFRQALRLTMIAKIKLRTGNCGMSGLLRDPGCGRGQMLPNT